MMLLPQSLGNAREEQFLDKVANELLAYAGPGRSRWASSRRRVLNAFLEASEVSERLAITGKFVRLRAAQ